MLTPAGTDSNVQQPIVEGVTLDASAVVSALNERNPGVQADPAGRLGHWHPKIHQWQGLYYNDKHICGMDRGEMPMWPVWNMEEELVEAPLAYAMTHEDMPVLTVDPNSKEGMEQNGKALVMRRQIDSLNKVGWAEVFWKLIEADIPDITPEWLGSHFNVPMDWLGRIDRSPIGYSFLAAAEKGFV